MRETRLEHNHQSQIVTRNNLMCMNTAFGPDPYLEDILERLSNNDESLTEIALHGSRLAAKTAEEFALRISFNTTVTRMDLRYCFFEGGISTIARALETNETLKELTVLFCGADDNDAVALSNLLSMNKTLSSLTCGMGCIMTQSGVRTLINGLNHNQGLEDLDLSGCSAMSDECASDLAQILKRNKCTLKKINLMRTQLNNSGARHLAWSLQRNTCLEMIDVSRTRVTMEGASAFGDVLKNQNTTLKTISRSFESSISGGCCWTEIDHFLAQNRAGRALLRNIETSVSLAPHLLVMAANEPHVMYGLLKQAPHVWTRA